MRASISAMVPALLLPGMFAHAGPVRRYEVYAPPIQRGYVYESDREGLAYNHCPTVIWFQDRWWAAWNANVLPGEPSPGHQIYMSTSRDGRVWSEPFAPFSDPLRCEQAARYPKASQWQPVFIIVNDELWCLHWQSSRDLAERGTGFARLAAPDARWTLRVLDWGVSGGLVSLLEMDWGIFPSQNPIQLRSGRFLVPVVLIGGRAPDAPEKATGFWANEKRASVIYTDDRGETWHVSPGCTPADRTWAPWEPTVWEQSDGSVRMVFRHNIQQSFIDEMPTSAEFLYGASSRDRGETWTEPDYVPIETVCSRMYVAPLDGRGIWSPVHPEEDCRGRLHLMLHHDFPGGQGWAADRRDLALFFRRGDGFEFTAGPSFSALEPRAVYPQHGIHDGVLLILYTQSHLEKRSIRYARITSPPDPEKRYLLPRADVAPCPRPRHEGRLLHFESLARQHLTARRAPPLPGGSIALAAWIRPDSHGRIWDNRVGAAEGSRAGFVWGLAGLGGKGDRALEPVMELRWARSAERVLGQLPVHQGRWVYAGLELDYDRRRVRFFLDDRMEEIAMPEGLDIPATGLEAVIGAPREPGSREPAFHGDLRYLAAFDQPLGPDGHRAMHDRFAGEFEREALAAPGTPPPSPALELDPANDRQFARDFVLPEAGFQGARTGEHEGRQVLRFTGEGSAGVDVDENHRERGDQLRVRFRAMPLEGQRLVFCTVGDANAPARVEWRDGEVLLCAGGQQQRGAAAPRGQWTTIEVTTAEDHTTLSVDEGDPVTVKHAPEGTWFYLGQGYRTGEGSAGDVFLVDTASVESQVSGSE